MTDDEMGEMIGLYLDGALPAALRAAVERYLADHPEARRDVETQRIVIDRLRASPSARPDDWFVERALDGLLRENARALDPRAPSQTTLRFR